MSARFVMRRRVAWASLLTALLALSAVASWAAETTPELYSLDVVARFSPSGDGSSSAPIPGHAFVILGKELASGGKPKPLAFGQYPVDGAGVGFREAIPGVIKNEEVKAADQLGNVVMRTWVTKEQYDKILQVKEQWAAKGTYELLERDCVTFAGEVMRAAGLNVPPRPVAPRPHDFVNASKLANVFKMRERGQLRDALVDVRTADEQRKRLDGELARSQERERILKERLSRAEARVPAETARIDAEIAEARTKQEGMAGTREKALADLRSGRFCSKCGWSATEIVETGETFEEHLGRVHSTSRPAPEDMIQKRMADFDVRSTNLGKRIQRLEKEKLGLPKTVEQVRNDIAEHAERVQALPGLIEQAKKRTAEANAAAEQAAAKVKAQESGGPSPASAPSGHVAKEPKSYVGKSVGSGQCVEYVRQAAGLPQTKTWREGIPVKGADIPKGTAIATFVDGKYPQGYPADKKGMHAAIYDGQDATGIFVYDQWIKSDGTPQNVHRRKILFRDGDGYRANDGDFFSVIKLDGE